MQCHHLTEGAEFVSRSCCTEGKVINGITATALKHEERRRVRLVGTSITEEAVTDIAETAIDCTLTAASIGSSVILSREVSKSLTVVSAEMLPLPRLIVKPPILPLIRHSRVM